MSEMLPKKDCLWVASAKDDLKKMPEDVQDQFGFGLLQAQRGGKATFAKPLQGFGGASVLELIDNFDTDTYRCVYTVQFSEAIYVLHAFQKKSTTGRKTSQRDIELITSRLRLAENDYQIRYVINKQYDNSKRSK